MPIVLTWPDLSIRIGCALVAGVLLGLNRTEHGRAAGLRTAILVCLAACLAMCQVNLLLPLAGRTPSSFVMNDLMRLPLGILSGMGFIGAGAIVRRKNLVVGVTTAAGMWFLTVIGLCFGGGQIALGAVGTALGLGVLWGLKAVEDVLNRDRQGSLKIVTALPGPHEDEIRTMVEGHGFRVTSWAFTSAKDANGQELDCNIRWTAKANEPGVPIVARVLAAREDIVRVSWRPKA